MALSRNVYFLILCLVFILWQCPAIASQQQVVRYIVTENSGILITSGDDSSVLIQEGRITAVEGGSVKLKPGTHIKSGEQFSISIVSNKHHEKLVQKESLKRRRETESILLSCFENTPAQYDTAMLFRTMQPLPASPAKIGHQLIVYAILPSHTHTSQLGHTVIFQKHISSLKAKNHLSSFRHAYCLDYSWGKRAECKKVMLT